MVAIRWVLVFMFLVAACAPPPPRVAVRPPPDDIDRDGLLKADDPRCPDRPEDIGDFQDGLVRAGPSTRAPTLGRAVTMSSKDER